MTLKYCYILMSLLAAWAGTLSAQNVRTAGASQLQGPIWMVEGPTRLEFVSDLNGDGQLDLVHRTLPNAAFPNRMKAALSTPDGGYAQEFFALQLPTGTQKIISGDFNGDGLADMIVEVDASEPTYGRSLLIKILNGSGVASGGFGLLSPLTDPIQFLEVCDFDGDGDDDFGLMYADSVGQSIFLWIETLGGGAFAPRPGYVLPAGVSRTLMSHADFNNDGIQDVCFLTATGIERYTTLGSSLVAAATVPHGLPSIGGDTAALRTHDLDGDGDLDYVVAESAAVGFQVILDQGTHFAQGPVLPSAKLNPNNFVRHLVGIGDTNGDGLPEIIFHDRLSSAYSTDYGSLEYYRGAAVLNPEMDLSVAFNPASGFALSTWQPRLMIDMDGDGSLDIVGNAGVIFGLEREQRALETLAQRGKLFDADMDGDLDIVEPGLIRHNNGAGRFETASTGVPRLPINPPAGLMAVSYLLSDGYAQADFNGDGRLDLITTAQVTPLVGPSYLEARLLYGVPGGKLVDQGAAAAGQRILGKANKGMIVADVDSDGDLDLLVDDVIWVNAGNNQFSPDINVIAGFSPIQAIQFDADLGLEVLLRLSTPGAPGLFFLDPQPNGSLILFQASPSLTGTELLADMDNDGDIDLIFQDYLVGQLYIFQNQGGILMPSWGSGPGFFSLGKMSVADIDQDGSTDFVVGDKLYQNQTPGNVLGFALVGLLGYTVEELADLDNDGDPDFFGGVVQFNRQFGGGGAGYARQYGKGSLGSGNIRPLLGAQGPLRTTSSNASLRFSDAVGGASSMLFVGFAPDATPDFMLPGLTSYVALSSVINVYNLNLGGPINVPGAGELQLSFPILPNWAGLRVYMQASFVDPGAAVSFAVTNGLEMQFGN